MKLSELQNGQIVRCREGVHSLTGIEPIWGEWADKKLYVDRRDKPLAKKYHRQTRAPNVGDILILTVGGAEFSQGDFDNGIFNCEDYLLEIEGVIE